jgi:hypothetical protein
MYRRLTRWWALPRHERVLFPWLMLALAAVSALLALLGYRRTRRLLEWLVKPRQEHRTATPDDLATARRLSLLVAVAGRHAHATCLRQALLLHTLLRRRGLTSDIRFGARRNAGPMPAMHAWVELQGIPLDPASSRHRPFADSTPHHG